MEHGGRQVRRLAQVAALWPLAMAFQGLSAVMASVALMGSLAVLGLSALLIVTSLIRLRHRPDARLRLALASAGARRDLLAAVIGAALVTLQWMVVHDSDGTISQTAIVMVTGALSLSAMALYPIRPAMIGYAGGMVLAMAPHMGLMSTLAGVATVLLILFHRHAAPRPARPGDDAGGHGARDGGGLRRQDDRRVRGPGYGLVLGSRS